MTGNLTGVEIEAKGNGDLKQINLVPPRTIRALLVTGSGGVPKNAKVKLDGDEVFKGSVRSALCPSQRPKAWSPAG